MRRTEREMRKVSMHLLRKARLAGVVTADGLSEEEGRCTSAFRQSAVEIGNLLRWFRSCGGRVPPLEPTTTAVPVVVDRPCGGSCTQTK